MIAIPFHRIFPFLFEVLLSLRMFMLQITSACLLAPKGKRVCMFYVYTKKPRPLQLIVWGKLH